MATIEQLTDVQATIKALIDTLVARGLLPPEEYERRRQRELDSHVERMRGSTGNRRRHEQHPRRAIAGKSCRSLHLEWFNADVRSKPDQAARLSKRRSACAPRTG